MLLPVCRRLVSSKFGYGVLNADALVKAATQWKTLGAQIVHQVQAPMPAIGLLVDEYDGLSRSITVTANDTKSMFYMAMVHWAPDGIC